MQVFAGSTAEAVNLKHAILLYETFATVHDVELKGGKQPVIKPGELATKEGLISALRALLPETERGTGLLAENILATGVDHMVWWVKPATREVWFSCKDIGGERHAPVPNPGLVMVVSKSGWHVFAVKGKDRPTPETELFQVPYFNVWAGGKICTGTARTPQGADAKKPKAWEDAFFQSFFTHPNIHAPQKLVAKGGAFKFWKDMLDGRYQRFPEGMLVATKQTMQSMYNTLVMGR